MPATNQYLCITASQRAGTTALQSALGSTGHFFNCREIFQTEPSDSPANYLRFCADRNLSIADNAKGTEAEALAVAYLQYLREISAPQFPLFDIKFNSWHAIRPFWSYVHQVPTFLRLLMRERAHFLFIRRRDVVEQVVSERIARAASKWHGLTDADVVDDIQIDPLGVATQARLIIQSETFLLECLGTYQRLAVIDYEDLYPDGVVNPRLMRWLQERFMVTLPEALTPSIHKNAPDKRRIVANYDEVARAVNAAIDSLPRASVVNRIT